MNARTLIAIIVVLAAVGGGAYFIMSSGTGAPVTTAVQPTTNTTNTTGSTNSSTNTTGDTTGATGSANTTGTSNTGSTGSTAPTPKPTPTPTPTPAPTPSGITMAQIATHGNASSCWSAINGNAYDLTKYIPVHPGGQEQVLMICGKDGSSLFNGQHGGSKKVASVLATMKLGAIAN